MTPEELQALMDRATRPRRTVPIVLNGDLRQRIEELLVEQEQLQTESAGTLAEPDRRLATRPSAPLPARLAELDAELDLLYDEAEQVTLHVVVEGLAGTPWQAFKAQYPPRDGIKADTLWQFNTAEGREPLIRATAIGHRSGETLVDWAEGQLDWLVGWVSDWQADKLFLAAVSTCRGDDAVPLRQPRSTTPSSAGG